MSLGAHLLDAAVFVCVYVAIHLTIRVIRNLGGHR